MGIQPNLASRPDVVSGAVPQKFGAQKKHQILDHFLRLPHSTPHISGTKRHIDKQKCKCQYTMCP